MMNRDRAGFTLIEILISLTILVVGLVGLLALFPVAASSSNQSAQDSHGSILAKSIKNAVVDGVRSARIVPHTIGSTDVNFYEIPFQHSGVPHEGGVGPANWIPNSDANLGENINGTYYIGLPVDPEAALLAAPGQLPSMPDVSIISPYSDDPDGIHQWVYYFPRRGLITPGQGVPVKSGPAGTNSGTPDDQVDLDAPGNQRVFYNGKWSSNNGSAPFIQTFKQPDRILDLERGGRLDEGEMDPFAQYSYRLEFRPVVEQRNVGGIPTPVLVDGLWSCKVFIFRHYEEYDTNDNVPDMIKSVNDTAQWYDFSNGIENNNCIATFTYHVALR